MTENNIFKTLQETTGHESGIVLYADRDGSISTGIIQNWSSEVGIPRISPFGTIMSWPGDIIIEYQRIIYQPEINQILSDLNELLNFSSASDIEIESGIAKAVEATIYELKSGDKVIVFPDWA